MSDSKPVALPAHLWEALDIMSSEMGLGRDALVSQAVFTLARLNGYVVPGRGLSAAAASAPAAAAPAPAPNKPASVAKPAAKPAPAPAAKKPVPEPEPEPEPDPEPLEEENNFDEPAGDDYQEEPVAEDPVDDPQDEDLPPEDEPEPAPPPRSAVPSAKSSLTLVMANRDPFKMTTDSVTIGRGKTCEFIIESNRVSREHARVFREAGGFIIEDLKSSNGTFFGPNKEKVTNRRPIRDGDEYTFGTEKVKFQIRK